MHATTEQVKFIPDILTLMTQNLYNLNVRKMVVMGLAPIGCAPHYLWQYGSENGECVEQINDMAIEFNFLMRYMVEKLGEELSDANITFCDVLEGSMDILKNHERYGSNVCVFLPLNLLGKCGTFNITCISLCFMFPYQALMSHRRPAVDLGSTRAGSCAYHQKWYAVTLPTISGGTSSIQLMQ